MTSLHRKKGTAERRITRIWKWYKRRQSNVLRDALVEHYAPLLLREAKKLRVRLPATVEIDDLVSDGALGLLDAIDRFDPGKSCFKTFSGKRIRGAMIDGLRSRDTVSRSTRRTLRTLEEAADYLRVTAGVPPTPAEVAERLGVPIREYARKERVARETVTRSLSGARAAADQTEAELNVDRLADTKQECPSRAAVRESLREMITTGFSRDERLIVILYYYEGLNMREIGESLRLSESRICQMHTSIIARLKARVEESELEI